MNSDLYSIEVPPLPSPLEDQVRHFSSEMLAPACDNKHIRFVADVPSHLYFQHTSALPRPCMRQ